MRHLKSILAFLFVLLPVLAYGQVTQLSGPVKNNANAVVPNATVTFVLTNCGSSAPTNPVEVAIDHLCGLHQCGDPQESYVQMRRNGLLPSHRDGCLWQPDLDSAVHVHNTDCEPEYSPDNVCRLRFLSHQLRGAAAILDAQQIGGVYQVDQFAGADIGVKLAACLNGLELDLWRYLRCAELRGNTVDGVESDDLELPML